MLVDTFANRLRKALNNANLTQSQLAEKTKIDKSLISNYLSGNYNAKQDKLSLIANALGVTETWLMGYDVPMDDIEMSEIWKEKKSIMEDLQKREFSLSLYELLRYFQIDKEKLSTLTGITKEKIDDFINCKSLPTDIELEKIVDLFNLKDKSELFNGSVVRNIIKKYNDEGNKLIDKYRFGLEFENMLIELSKELNISLEKIKSIIFDRENDLTILGTYNDLYNFIKRVIKEKI